MVTKIHFGLKHATIDEYDKSIIDLTASKMKNMSFEEIKQIITEDKETYIKIMKSWNTMQRSKYGLGCAGWTQKNILKAVIHRFSGNDQTMLTKQQADKITIKQSEHLKVVKGHMNQIKSLKKEINNKNIKMRNMKRAGEILKKGYYDSLLLMEEEWKVKLNGEKLAHRNKCERGECEQGKCKQSDCVICQDVIGAANSCTLGCGHTYHLSCIATWMANEKNTCPTCRAEQEGFKPIQRPKCVLHGASDCETCYSLVEIYLVEMLDD
jgi:hypothetical protein